MNETDKPTSDQSTGDRPQDDGGADRAGAKAAILTSHYESVRQNILVYVKTSDQYIYYAFGAIGFVFSFTSTQSEDARLVFTIPVICFVSAILHAHAEMIIGTMCLWLKDEYSAGVNRAVGVDIPHWDASDMSRIFFSRAVFGRRSYALAALYLTTNLAGLYLLAERYALSRDTTFLREEIIFGLERQCFLLFFLAIYLTLAVCSVLIVFKVGKERRRLHFNDLADNNQA